MGKAQDEYKARQRAKDPEGWKAYQAQLARNRRAVLKVENPELIKARDAHKNTTAQHRTHMANWRSENANHVREYERDYRKQAREANPLVKLRTNLRTRLNRAIRAGYKSGSAVRDLGCSIEQLKIHLEAQFALGMSWDNWGEWHIDHIKPLSAFDLTDRAQFLVACHYSNLQPLWKSENLRKSNKA